MVDDRLKSTGDALDKAFWKEVMVNQYFVDIDDEGTRFARQRIASGVAVRRPLQF